MTSVNKHNLAPQRTADTQHNVKDAALHGASLAFSKPPPKPKPLVNTYTGGSNGALLAATRVGSPQPGGPAGSPASLTADWAGGSLRNTGRPRASPPMPAGSRSNSSQSLVVPDDHLDRGSSPSNIAARLAAARYSPLRHTPQATAAMSERHPDERHVFPSSGSVGKVLARLETGKSSQQPREGSDSPESQSVASSIRSHPVRDHKPLDDTPIPPTTSLVKMFEQNRAPTPTKPSVRAQSTTQHSPPPVRSPKPRRAFKLPPEPQDDAPLARQRTQTPPPVKPKPQHKIELPPSQFTNDTPYFSTPQKDPMKSPPIKQKPLKLTALRTSTPPPKPPQQRGTRQVRPKSEDIKRSTSIRRISTSMASEKDPESPASFKSAKEMQEKQEEKAKPTVPPPRRSNTRKLDTAPSAGKPHPTAPVPIAPRKQDQPSAFLRSPTRFSPPRQPISTSGTSPASVYHNSYQRDSVKQIAKHMTGESLSSAIMGAALASSRNASPAPAQSIPIEPLFPPRKQHHHHSPFRRSPSPPKQSPPKSSGKLRTTMRKEPSSSEDEDEIEKYKKKGSRIMGIKQRKHPNKHHEGTRKRWRDQITDRERKRYEGVWAANKGLYLPVTSGSPSRALAGNDASQDVLNLVAQDIWLRSRLPTHVLEEVWDLVDSQGIGRLKRSEFVVGLWLIDQRLKGRKLPVKVSDSVWASASGVGIKVKVRR